MQNKQEYLWAMIGRFAPQIIYLLTTIILARFLTPNDFGIIGVLSVFFMVANVLDGCRIRWKFDKRTVYF